LGRNLGNYGVYKNSWKLLKILKKYYTFCLVSEDNLFKNKTFLMEHGNGSKSQKIKTKNVVD
jgi:hypothetical protein